jgi:hypothetical protein
MQIKHQNPGVRDVFPGTAVDGRTIIRHNVFCKEANGSTGANARPNLLLGAFPPSGSGAGDLYEVYGNFFYQNPNEALLQATGNLALYANVFVNHSDPSGFRAVYVTAQNGSSPRSIRIFHNTVWAANTEGGMRLYSPDPSFRQYCHANAVFSTAPITNFTDTLNNTVDSYANASRYAAHPTLDLGGLDLYPVSGALKGAGTPSAPFTPLSSPDRDFNGDVYDWTYRGAYAGQGVNPGWKLQLDTMSEWRQRVLAVQPTPSHVGEIRIFPQPAGDVVTLMSDVPCSDCTLNVYDVQARSMLALHLDVKAGFHTNIDVREWKRGPYLIVLYGNGPPVTQLFMR